MRFKVFELPQQECTQVGSKRAEGPYNEARERLAAAVWEAAPRGVEPFTRPHVSVVAHVGSGKDGLFRPECAHSLQPALDGLFDGLIRANIIKSVASIPLISTGVTRVETREEEGLMIVLTELEEAV